MSVGILSFLCGYSQTIIKQMELHEIIKDKNSISTFIDQNFELIVVDRKTLIDTSHSLVFEEFNRKIKPNNKYISVYGIPVNDAYAYKKDSSFALYLLVEVDINNIEQIVKYLGLPENIEEYTEIKSGQFAFLNWKFDSLFFWLDKDIFANSKYKTSNKCILTITNMSISQIRNKEKLL